MNLHRQVMNEVRTVRSGDRGMSDAAFTIILAAGAAVAASILALPVTMPNPASVPTVHSQMQGEPPNVLDHKQLTSLTAERLGLPRQAPGRTEHPERVN